MGTRERRQREREKRRTDILRAAEAVFLEKGLAAATMEEIAARAEISKGTVYLYFKGKDELFLAAATHTLELGIERVLAAGRDAENGLDRVRRMGRAHLRFAMEESNRFRVAMSWLWSEYVVSSDSPLFGEYRARIARLFSIAVSAIEEGQGDGSIRDDVPAPRLATQLWGGMVGVALVQSRAEEVARRLPGGVELDDLGTSYLEMVLRGLQGSGRVRELAQEGAQ